MTYLFVNLKRFDVPRRLGGVSEFDDPAEWTQWVLRETGASGVYDHNDLQVVYLLPESSLMLARDEVARITAGRRATAVSIGCQGVYRQDVGNANFGAFSTNRPAAAARALTCEWAMIGHSEERFDKEGVITAYDPKAATDPRRRNAVRQAVDRLIAEEVKSASERGLRVLLCVGEKSDERSNLSTETPDEAVYSVLASQLDLALEGISGDADEIVVGYEPIWAIGPGKTPPAAGYIAAVASFIKTHIAERIGRSLPVVYGGGLKEENAGNIGGISSVDGGLVALTRFAGSIGFYPKEFETIVEKFLAARGVQ